MKKPKAIKLSPEHVFVKYMGDEPSWCSQTQYTEADKMRGYNWYNYAIDASKRMEILLAYLPSEDVDVLKRLPEYSVPNHVVAKIRMMERGFVFSQEDIERLKASIAKLLEQAKKIQEHTKEILVAKSQDSASMRRDRLSNLIGSLDREIDLFLKKNFKSNFDISSFLRGMNVKPDEMKAIQDYFTPILNEMELVSNKKIKEGYDLKPKQVKSYIEFLRAIISACAVTKPQRQRAARKAKPISPEKMVSRVKYQSEDAQLNLKSMKPTKLIGAKEVWLYNTKARLLSYYKAADNTGITVRGSSLVGYDEQQSQMRKIRKPETLEAMMSRGVKAIHKDFMALRVKPIPCNGRLNPFTLILKA